VPQGLFSFDTVLMVIPNKIDILVLLGLLNSDLWEWRFRCTSTTNHVNEYELVDLLVPPSLLDGTALEFKKLRSLVSSVLESRGSVARRSDFRNIPRDSPDFQIDDVVFDAYGLTGVERAVVRDRLDA
jgi:hypothetical protein